MDQYVQSDGARVWTTVHGQGLPVLLCNGGPGCCDYLAPVAEMIDDICQVFRFEQRGCGRSDKIRPYDVSTCVSDMERIREHYGIDRWVVGGHSWGPDLAIAYALTHSDRVAGILGISGGVLHKDRAWSEQYHRLKDTVGEFVAEFQFPPNMEVNSEVSSSWSEFARRPGFLREVAELNIPAVFIYGERDIRPSWPVEQIAALLPKGQFILIKEAEHVIWHTHGTELKEHLRHFMAQVVEGMKGEQTDATDG